jgi:hypothetical protein
MAPTPKLHCFSSFSLLQLDVYMHVIVGIYCILNKLMSARLMAPPTHTCWLLAAAKRIHTCRRWYILVHVHP